MENKYVERAEDQHIRGELLYVKETADGYVYTDAECTIKADKALLKQLFKMNTAVIVDGASEYRPIYLTNNTAKACIDLTYIKAVTTTATLTVVHSAEYTA